VERDVVCTKRTKNAAESVPRIDFVHMTCKNTIASNVHQIPYVNMITSKDAAYTVRHTVVYITKQNHTAKFVHQTRFANTEKPEANAENVTQMHSVNIAVGRDVVDIVQRSRSVNMAERKHPAKNAEKTDVCIIYTKDYAKNVRQKRFVFTRLETPYVSSAQGLVYVNMGE